MEKVGTKLRKLREGSDLTQENISEALGISTSTLSRIENDYKGTKWLYITQLCNLYKVSVYELLTPVEEKLIIREELLVESLQRILEKLLEKFYEDKLEIFLENLDKELSRIVIAMINKSLEK
jgi:transcriptional regulator with XRE-family HTH domain